MVNVYRWQQVAHNRQFNLLFRHCGLALFSISALLGTVATPISDRPALAETAAPPGAGQPLTLRSDIQEANAVTGVITARGNVQINYPARQIQATAVQAQYYSRERRIVLSGNVYVLQQGNSLRGDTITYLVDEGRFVATPQTGQQVESIYIVTDPNPAGTAPAVPQPTSNSRTELREPAGSP